MASIEVREIALETGETSPSGDTLRTEKSWQLGATIDGVFVPFATVTQGNFDHAKQRQEAAEAREGKTSKKDAADKSTDAAK